MINLYSSNLTRSLEFYSALGFVESFRTPATGTPAHVELKLDGFTFGIATADAAARDHGLGPSGKVSVLEIVL